jgi:hypothetical protein
MVNARICLDEETNKIINIYKAKKGLKTKNEAINVFIKNHGQKEIYPDVKDEYVLDFDKKVDKYLKENPKLKSISKKDFYNLFK